MFRTSFSIGLSPYSTKDELNLILEAADKNMYEDKLIIKKRIPGINI
jgi:GGDEF domain-containing protein